MSGLTSLFRVEELLGYEPQGGGIILQEAGKLFDRYFNESDYDDVTLELIELYIACGLIELSVDKVASETVLGQSVSYVVDQSVSKSVWATKWGKRALALDDQGLVSAQLKRPAIEVCI